MSGRIYRLVRKSVAMGLTALLVLAAFARAQTTPATSAARETETGSVTRWFGAEGGYRTQVRSEAQGSLSKDDRRQISLLAAQIFQHIEQARRALETDNTKQAQKEVAKGNEAVKAIRAILPMTNVHTKTTAPDGKVIYEDERQVQDEQVPLFEGMLHARTFAPIQEARRDANRIVGVQVVESEAISTEATADLGFVGAQLARAAKAISDQKTGEAAKALLLAQTRGVGFRYNQEDTPLAEARDAIWLAKRALEENNAVQAQANLTIARQRLEIYRKVLPDDKRQDLNEMIAEVNQMEDKLRREVNRPATHSERSQQGNVVTRWWDQLNNWFKRPGK